MSQRFDQSLQTSNLIEIPASSESQPLRGEYAACHLPVQGKPLITEAGDHRTVVEPSGGHTFACMRHQWASRTVIDLDDLAQACPHCVLEMEERAGRLRYAALQLRLTASLG